MGGGGGGGGSVTLKHPRYHIIQCIHWPLLVNDTNQNIVHSRYMTGWENSTRSFRDIAQGTKGSLLGFSAVGRRRQGFIKKKCLGGKLRLDLGMMHSDGGWR